MSFTQIRLEEKEVDVTIWKNPDPRLITIYLTKAIRLEFPVSKMKQLLKELSAYDKPRGVER